MVVNICNVCGKECNPMFLVFASQGDSWRVCIDCVVEKLGAPRELLEKCMKNLHTAYEASKELGDRLVELSATL